MVNWPLDVSWTSEGRGRPPSNASLSACILEKSIGAPSEVSACSFGRDAPDLSDPCPADPGLNTTTGEMSPGVIDPVLPGAVMNGLVNELSSAADLVDRDLARIDTAPLPEWVDVDIPDTDERDESVRSDFVGEVRPV